MSLSPGSRLVRVAQGLFKSKKLSYPTQLMLWWWLVGGLQLFVGLFFAYFAALGLEDEPSVSEAMAKAGLGPLGIRGLLVLCLVGVAGALGCMWGGTVSRAAVRPAGGFFGISLRLLWLQAAWLLLWAAFLGRASIWLGVGFACCSLFTAAHAVNVAGLLGEHVRSRP